MNKKYIMLLSIIALLATISLLTLHWYAMSKNRSEIDWIENAILPFKNSLPRNSKIGFIIDVENKLDANYLFYQTQFVLVPLIATPDTAKTDTILFVEDYLLPTKKVQIHGKMDTLFTSKNERFSVKLIIKRK